jgi:hypothetical protein
LTGGRRDGGARAVSATLAQLDKARIRELTEREQKRLDEATPGSKRMFERARKALPGGVASSYQLRSPWPIYLERGAGPGRPVSETLGVPGCFERSDKPNLALIVRFRTSLVSETSTAMCQMSAKIVTTATGDRALQVPKGMVWTRRLVPRS